MARLDQIAVIDEPGFFVRIAERLQIPEENRETDGRPRTAKPQAREPNATTQGG